MKRRTQGLSLTELLLAGAMGALISTGLGVILVNFANSATTNTTTSEVKDEITGALTYIANELKGARYIYRPGNITKDAVNNCAANLADKTIPIYCAARMQTSGSIVEDGQATNRTGSLSLTNLVGGSNARIQLAFWVRATKPASLSCSTSYGTLPVGELVAVPNSLLTSKFRDSPGSGETSSCSLVGYGTLDTTPGYKLVVYYTAPVNTAISWQQGPNLLYRWESSVIAIPFTDFGYISATTASSIPTTSLVLTPPAPLSTNQSQILSDYLPSNGGITIASSPTNIQSIDLAIQGGLDSTSARENNYIPTNQKSAEEKRLLYRTTFFARNICGPGVTCPQDY